MIARIHGVRVAGISAAVPVTCVDNSHLSQFSEEERAKIINATGIQKRRVVEGPVCTSDLCFEAAKDVMASTGVTPESVGLLIFISQTPDYVLPATAIVLANRLGLPTSCAAFDVNLGCSGYTYGLWQAAALLPTTGSRNALLLVGDTISRIVSDEDKSALALFGDAGTATVLELTDEPAETVFDLGSDGAGARNLIVEAGGFRHRTTGQSLERVSSPDGNRRAATELFMDGPQVLNFTLREIPKSVKAVAAAAGWSMEEVDAFVFHQANKTMLDYLAKRAGVPAEGMAFSLAEFGNTSSATIPLTLAYRLADRLSAGSLKLVLSGFGVGWSWASCAIQIGPVPRPTLRTVEFQNGD
jgi:3-oxoacyl-[acyl-carrier-protein] synthase-3